MVYYGWQPRGDGRTNYLGLRPKIEFEMDCLGSSRLASSLGYKLARCAARRQDFKVVDSGRAFLLDFPDTVPSSEKQATSTVSTHRAAVFPERPRPAQAPSLSQSPTATRPPSTWRTFFGPTTRLLFRVSLKELQQYRFTIAQSLTLAKIP